MKRHKLAPVSAGSKKDEWVGFHFDFDLKTILPAPNRISLFDLKGDMQKGKKRTVRSLRTRVSSRPAKRVLSVELLWNPTKKKPTESNYTLRFWFFLGGIFSSRDRGRRVSARTRWACARGRRRRRRTWTWRGRRRPARRSCSCSWRWPCRARRPKRRTNAAAPTTSAWRWPWPRATPRTPPGTKTASTQLPSTPDAVHPNGNHHSPAWIYSVLPVFFNLRRF